MEKESSKKKKNTLLDAIKSKFIITKVLDYIPDIFFKYNLFKYSKFYQEKFNLTISDFKEKSAIRFNLDVACYFFDEETEYLKNNRTHYMKRNLLNDKKNYGFTKTAIENYVIYYYKKLLPEFIEKGLIEPNFRQKIAFESPFFDAVVKEDFFEKYFTLLISTESIDDKYFSKYKKINTKNLWLQYYMKYNKDIDDFNELKLMIKQ